QTLSDGQGHFHMAGLPRRDVNVVALSDTASSDTVTVRLADDAGRDLRITLALDGAIRGFVVDAAGKPVPDASPWAITRGGGGGRGGGRLRGPATDRTDQSGHFELRGLSDDSYLVAANRSGNAPWGDGGFFGGGAGGGGAAAGGGRLPPGSASAKP